MVLYSSLATSLIVFGSAWLCAADQVRHDVGVDAVDIAKYTGGWFELFTTQHVKDTMEYNCRCSQAWYDLNKDDPNKLDVLNGCRRWRRWTYVRGSAVQSNPIQHPGQLNVTLRVRQQDTQGQYNILKLWRDDNGNYPYALVGGGESNTLWLLGRSPMKPSEEIVDDALHQAKCDGYEVDDIVHANSQNCNVMPRKRAN
jgi:lipocalin